MKKEETILEEFIDSATNGQQAIDKFKRMSQTEAQYILIFMDCDMPIKDGYSAAKEIREYCKNNKKCQPYIIACTGHSEQRYV